MNNKLIVSASTLASIFLLQACDSDSDKSPAPPNSFVCGNAINDSSANSGGACVKVASVSNSTFKGYFTSSPSKAMVEELGFTPKIYHSENNNQYLKGRHDDITSLCHDYNNYQIADRANWRIPTKNELFAIAASKHNMSNYGWPVNIRYITDHDFSGQTHASASFKDGVNGGSSIAMENYYSCVSPGL